MAQGTIGDMFTAGTCRIGVESGVWLPRVANINFLRTISIHYQEKKF